MDSKIVIGFSKPKKNYLGSRLIAWWTGVEYSHCYVRFQGGQVQETVYHATGKMLHFLPASRFDEANVTVVEYSLAVDKNTKIEILRDCIELSGTEYSYCQLAMIFLYDLVYRLTKKTIHTADYKGNICSELVAKLLVKHFNKSFVKPLHLVSPPDIEDVLRG